VHDEDSPECRMQFAVTTGPADIDFLALFLASFDHLEEGYQGLSLLVVEVQGVWVGDPAMDTSSSRVYP
jgi:hypothetical protein